MWDHFIFGIVNISFWTVYCFAIGSTSKLRKSRTLRVFPVRLVKILNFCKQKCRLNLSLSLQKVNFMGSSFFCDQTKKKGFYMISFSWGEFLVLLVIIICERQASLTYCFSFLWNGGSLCSEGQWIYWAWKFFFCEIFESMFLPVFY